MKRYLKFLEFVLGFVDGFGRLGKSYLIYGVVVVGCSVGCCFRFGFIVVFS